MSETIGSVQGLSRDLEERLAAARREKSLAQVPALRRLRNTVRVLLVLGLIGLVISLFSGSSARQVWEVVDARDLGPLSRLAFVLFAMVVWQSLALGGLQLYSYSCFLLQFKKNHLGDLWETTGYLPRLLGYALVLNVSVLPISGAMYQSTEAVVRVFLGMLAGLVTLLVMFLFMRHYAKAAEADLSTLSSASGYESPRGNYPRWRSAYLTVLALALVVLVLGFFLGG